MSTNKIDTSKKDKVEQKVAQGELSEKQLDKPAGGGLNFGTIKTDYKTQSDTGTTTTITTK